jgi:hypothetical protein
MMYAIELASDVMIYIPSFMKIGTGIQAMLRFCLSNLRGCNVGITDGGFMKCSVEMKSGGMIYIPSFMMISSGIQVTFMVLPQQFERLQYCAVEMGSGGMTYLLSFMKDCMRHSKVDRGDTHANIHTDSKVIS